jgi:hypothetical protein
VWVFFIGHGVIVFLRQTGSFAPYWGRGNNLDEYFAYQPCARSIRLCISSLRCRNAVYNYLSGCRNADFRMQE